MSQLNIIRAFQHTLRLCAPRDVFRIDPTWLEAHPTAYEQAPSIDSGAIYMRVETTAAIVEDAADFNQGEIMVVCLSTATVDMFPPDMIIIPMKASFEAIDE